MAYLLNIDAYLTELLRNIIPHLPFFDYFFSFFSLRGNSIFIWILVIIFVLILEERKNPGISRKDKQFTALFLIAFLSTALIVEFPLKNLFHRLRPDFTRYTLYATRYTYSCPKDFSFPSGHASTAFAAATVLTFFDKKRRWLYFATAILIAYSRIYLGCHFFLDVLIGALIGFFFSKLILLLNKN